MRIAVVLAITLSICLSATAAGDKITVDFKPLVLEVGQYLKGRSVEKWWLGDNELAATKDPATMQRINVQTSTIIVKLLAYSKKDPEMAKMLSSYYGFIPGVYQEGQKHGLKHWGRINVTNPDADKKSWIIVATEGNSGRGQGLLGGDAVKHVIFSPAVDLPDNVLMPGFAHELCHDYLGRTGVIDYGKPADRLRSEILAFEYEGRVLDKLSGGKYKKAVGAIIKKYPARQPFELITQVKASDYKALEKTFAKDPLKFNAAESLLVEFCLELGFEKIDQAYTPKTRLEGKIQFMQVIFKLANQA